MQFTQDDLYLTIILVQFTWLDFYFTYLVRFIWLNLHFTVLKQFTLGDLLLSYLMQFTWDDLYLTYLVWLPSTHGTGAVHQELMCLCF